MLQRDEDRKAEADVAVAFASAFGGIAHHYGTYDPIDYWIEKGGRIAAYAEVKCYARRYETTWLNARKWGHLMAMRTHSGVPALFVVRWAGTRIGYIDVLDIDARRQVIGRRGPRANGARGANDCEPVVVIPTSAFTPLAGP